MKQNEFLRFALVLSDGRGLTFNKNLEKLVILVLFDFYGEYISVGKIVKEIEEKYGLTFLPTEVENVILSSQKSVFLKSKDKKSETKYTIRPETYNKLLDKQSNVLMEKVIDRFFDINADVLTINKDEFEEVLYKHIYDIFNSDISTLLSLLNIPQQNKEQNDDDLQNPSIEDRTALNMFLLWDDAEKNELLYNITSSCFEFCMMTVRKDNHSFSKIFRGKEFYLDTNIIFRLAGFNNNDRKYVMDSFIKRCKDCGIRLKYTNFTQKEIEESLKWHVQGLKDLLAKKVPVDPTAVQLMYGKNISVDFYAQYVKWAEQPQNELGDYNGFLLSLKKVINNILREFEFVSFESFDSDYREKNFKDICDEYKRFKVQKSKDVREESIKIDIENYLFIRNKIADTKHNSFVDKNIYFITADHTLIDWAESKRPGNIPDFILPSVWYSIILKYHGRSDDDYSAFCQFLKVQERNVDEELDHKEIRKEILAHILALDESKLLKEEIIFDIDQRLKEEEMEIDDVENYIEISKHNVMAAHIEDEIEKREEQLKKTVSDLQNEHRKELSSELEKGVEIGGQKEREEIVQRQVDKLFIKNSKRRKWLKRGIVGVAIIAAINSILCILGFTGTRIVMLPNFIENNEGAIALASWSFPILGFVVKPYLDKKIFSTDKEELRLQVEKNLLEED